MTGPFRFNDEVALIKAASLAADDLSSLLAGLRRASDSSIFYHVHHALFRRHFAASEMSNDFARWAWITLREEPLAERLAAVDPLQFRSIPEARDHLIGIVESYAGRVRFLARVPREHEFHFCEAQTFVFPTGHVSEDLEGFLRGIRGAGSGTIFHHFIAARLRVGLPDNDFSAWIEALGDKDLADRIRRLSPFRYTLWELRDRMAAMIEEHLSHG